jgi:hypothetical protein
MVETDSHKHEEVGDMQVSHSWVVTLGIEGCERFRHSSLSAHVQARACMHNKQTSMYTFSILHCDHHSFIKEFTFANYSKFFRENGQRFVHKQKNFQERTS